MSSCLSASRYPSLHFYLRMYYTFPMARFHRSNDPFHAVYMRTTCEMNKSLGMLVRENSIFLIVSLSYSALLASEKRSLGFYIFDGVN